MKRILLKKLSKPTCCSVKIQFQSLWFSMQTTLLCVFTFCHIFYQPHVFLKIIHHIRKKKYCIYSLCFQGEFLSFFSLIFYESKIFQERIFFRLKIIFVYLLKQKKKKRGHTSTSILFRKIHPKGQIYWYFYWIFIKYFIIWELCCCWQFNKTAFKEKWKFRIFYLFWKFSMFFFY